MLGQKQERWLYLMSIETVIKGLSHGHTSSRNTSTLHLKFLCRSNIIQLNFLDSHAEAINIQVYNTYSHTEAIGIRVYVIYSYAEAIEFNFWDSRAEAIGIQV